MTDLTCLDFKKYCGLKSCESMLDVVILWVNGSDPILQSKLSVEKEKLHANLVSSGKNRFRELGQIKYSFRSIEANLPLARRIFLVTNGQVPSWLDTNHKQIRIVDHSDLGLTNTFNSMAIQSVVYRIPTLSSPYLYSEDDIFFGSKLVKDFLFDGKSKVYISQNVRLNAKDGYTKTVLKSKKLVESLGVDLSSLVSGEKVLYNSHVAMMMYPEEMERIWKTFGATMKEMISHKFRNENDPHLPSLYTFMQVGRGNSKLLKERKTAFFCLTESNYKEALKQMVKYRKTAMVCANDDFKADPSTSTLDEVDRVYRNLFPVKSKFEL